MARPQNQKRQRVDEPSRDNPPAKRVKRAKQNERPNFSPEFWDNLSKVWLTPRALRELDRRNSARSPRFTTPEACSKDLARFARHGGPDLRHLRGHSEQQAEPHAMSSSALSRSARTRSTKATTVTSKGKRSSAYDKGFEQHINDYNIYTNNRKSKPKNGTDLRVLWGEKARGSLSPSRFSDGAFEAFQDANSDVGSEGDVMRKIIPVISGDANFRNSSDVLFNNLVSITNETTVDAKPDFYDGARSEDIHQAVRNDLEGLIIPSKNGSRPVAPNLFLEAKSPWGGADIAKRQACLDGAYGARAMHALQNYGEEEPQYDGNAYAYSSTYHAGTGTLSMYAHHVTAPTTEGGRPGYHMTQVRGFAITSDRETFIQGATAFRNARDLARTQRDDFIQAANAKASRGERVASQKHLDTTTGIQYDEDSTDELALSPPHFLYADDDSPDPRQTSLAPDVNDPSASFATSFTSLSSHQTRSKRQRSPRSNAQEDQASKSRTRRRSAGDVALSSTNSTQVDATESFWVETYWRKGKLCFKNPQDQEVKTEVKDWVEEFLDDGSHCLYWESPKSGRVFWATELATEPKRKKKGGR